MRNATAGDDVMSTEQRPHATVVISTRDRGWQIDAAISSVLCSDLSTFELLVIDQSTADDTMECVLGHADDPRVHYVRTSTIGLSRSRNLALAEATHDIIIMTDDDCVISSNFVRTMIAELSSPHPATLVFADVLDPDIGAPTWTPVNRAPAGYTVDSVQKWRSNDGVNIGIGAAMAFRRRSVVELGGFDEELGAGGTYQSAEDTDLALRVLLRGGTIKRITRTWVHHHGGRDYLTTRQLIHGGLFGAGATCGKLVRAGHRSVIGYFAGVWWNVVLVPTFQAVRRGRRPTVVRRATNLLRGFVAGWRAPIDRDRLVFVRASNRVIVA